MISSDMIDVTFSLVAVPVLENTGDTDSLVAKYQACQQTVSAIEKINLFLSIHKDCKIKYVTNVSVIVNGPKAKLQRFLNNKTAVESE